MELDDLRKEIDDIDKEMKYLFLKRMEIVKQIALIKKSKYDKIRHQYKGIDK